MYDTQKAPNKSTYTGKPVSTNDIEAQYQTGIDDEMTKKNKFVVDTLNYVGYQLLITTAITIYMYKNRTDVITSINQNISLLWVPIIMTFISLVAMYKCEDCRKSMFWVFTVCCSLMIGTSVLKYAPNIVFMAVVTTTFIVYFVN